MRGEKKRKAGQALERLAGTLSSKQLTLLVALLALAGIGMLWLWPAESAYLPATPASVALAREGQWVVLQGQVERVDAKASGFSVRVCSRNGGCVRIYSPDRSDAAGTALGLEKGQAVRAWGEVAAATGGTRYVRAHRMSMMDTARIFD